MKKTIYYHKIMKEKVIKNKANYSLKILIMLLIIKWKCLNQIYNRQSILQWKEEIQISTNK